jgi:carboxyl-terminal processing protease
MLGELNQSHFGIYPPNAQISATGFGEAEIGVDVQIIDKQVIVTRVEADSPAEKSGLKPGFVIKKVDGKTIAEILKSLDERLAKRKDTEAKKQLFRERILMTAICGKAGSSVNLEILDDRNKTQNRQISRVIYAGEMSTPMGNFPAQRVIFESKRLPENIGYIRFNVWVVPQMLKIRKAMRLLSDTDGIIFDLRGNPGGVGAMASGLAGLLVEKQSSLGTMKTRTGEAYFVAYPQKDAFSGKIVILTDYGTGSTSEVFAAGMQDIGRAKIVGETTAGAVLPSVMEKLPTGALFQYAIADYKSPNKILIEGRGVKPDIEVQLTRGSLLKGRDLQIEAAVKEISRKK